MSRRGDREGDRNRWGNDDRYAGGNQDSDQLYGAEEEIKMSDRGVGVIEKAVAALVAETGVVPLTVPVAAALVTVVEDEIIVVVEVTAEIEDRQNKALEKLTMGRAVLFRQHKLHRHQYRNFLLQRRLI